MKKDSLQRLGKVADLLQQCRQAIETTIDATPKGDYTLGALGPILSELRAAQMAIARLRGQ